MNALWGTHVTVESVLDSQNDNEEREGEKKQEDEKDE